MGVTSEPVLAAARFGARPRRGVLLGLSGPRLASLGVAAALATAGLFGAGMAGALLVLPAVIVLVAAAFVTIGGLAAVEWVPVAGQWGLRRVMGQDVYGVRPLAPRPAGTLALPGDGAAVRVHVDRLSGAAMLHDPHRRTLTATCVVAHPSFVLLGAEDQNRRVHGWSRVLAGLARTGHVASIQVLEHTSPDRGTAVADWWSAHGRQDSSWESATYAEFVAAAAPSSARHRTTISLSLDMRAASRAISRAGGGLRGAAAVLRSDMSSMHAALQAAELRPQHWIDENDIAAMIRSAYDPDVRDDADRSGVTRRVSSAGPVGVREHWSWFESDRAATAVLWISEWPRSNAYPNFLTSIVLAPGVRKSLSLIARPVPAAEARKDIRRQKVEYVTDADQKARIGQVADYSDAAEYQDLLAREQELAVGHADMRFAGLIAVTAPDKDALDAAIADVEQAAIQCECETRLLVGQQSQAFVAAALPLGRGL
jgi:hypothetical protein